MVCSCVIDAVTSVVNQLFQMRPICVQRLEAAKSVGYQSWRELPPGVSIFNVTSMSNWAQKVRDTRVDSWPLMSSPIPTFLIALVYIMLVLLGMYVFMKNRAPITTGMRPLMIIYNVIVIAINIYMFTGFVYYAYIRGGYSLICNPVDFDSKADGEAEYELLKLVYIYYLSKLVDFSDTFFMVVRKKFDQVSFLHVYHHSSMLFIWWFASKYGGGGDMVFGPMMNSFVHIIMYMYYLAALLKTRIPGKSHVTKLQLVQFFMVISQSIASLVFNCPYPQWALYCQVVFLTSLFVLFMQFYVKAYGLAGDKSRARKAVAAADEKKKLEELVVVGKAITLVKDDEAPATKAGSPKKKSASPSVGRASSKRSVSPARKSSKAPSVATVTAAPSPNRASSTGKAKTAASPTKAVASPRKRSATPSSPKARASSKKAASPKRAATPKGRASSKKAASPKRSASPKGRASSKKAASPKRSASPKGRASSAKGGRKSTGRASSTKKK